jgi:hypothetical protein
LTSVWVISMTRREVAHKFRVSLEFGCRMCCDDGDFWRSDVSTSDEEETDGTESREGYLDISLGDQHDTQGGCAHIFCRLAEP